MAVTPMIEYNPQLPMGKEEIKSAQRAGYAITVRQCGVNNRCNALQRLLRR
jgi:hypothetical protein